MTKKKENEKKVVNSNPSCPSCNTKKKMSIRQFDTNRDGQVVADIFACSECQAWLRIPRVENKAEEVARLKRRLAELE